jgi:hypothetical protein
MVTNFEADKPLITVGADSVTSRPQKPVKLEELSTVLEEVNVVCIFLHSLLSFSFLSFHPFSFVVSIRKPLFPFK